MKRLFPRVLIQVEKSLGIKHSVENRLFRSTCKDDEFPKILMELKRLKYHTIANFPIAFKPGQEKGYVLGYPVPPSMR